MKPFLFTLVLAATALLMGCVAPGPDYTAFREHRPSSILVLPPVNGTLDMKATPAVLSAAVAPLAEAGYYVIPVTTMMETFHRNGMREPEEIQAIPADKLIEFFGADAVLYISVEKYGTNYKIIDSVVEITAEAVLVDLRTGTPLWENRVKQSISSTAGNGPLASLIGALVSQIVNTASDKAWPASQQAVNLLINDQKRGVIAGPRLEAVKAERR